MEQRRPPFALDCRVIQKAARGSEGSEPRYPPDRAATAIDNDDNEALLLALTSRFILWPDARWWL